METKEAKLDAIRGALMQDISKHARLADVAFAKLEKMNVSQMEFTRANVEFTTNFYVAEYLRKIKDSAIESNEPLKAIENKILFHAYQHRTKGTPAAGTTIATIQSMLSEILDGYLRNYFEA